jgi:hypothetical protein
MPKYPIGCQVKVIHDYLPPEDHCLKLSIGEMITVVKSKNEDDEWVAGRNLSGKVGFFPALYVEFHSHKPSSKYKESNKETSSSLVSQIIQETTDTINLNNTYSINNTSNISDGNGANETNETKEGASTSLLTKGVPSAPSTAIKPVPLQTTFHPKGLNLNTGSKSRNNRSAKHMKKHSIGHVPSPRWLAPSHLTTVALFKYFADGHFGFDEEKSTTHHHGSMFKKKSLKVADLLKFGKKPIKLPLHRALWSNNVIDKAKASNETITTAVMTKAKNLQDRGVENFKNIMRYMGDLELDDRTLSLAAEIQNIERDGLRSKILQMGLSSCSGSSSISNGGSKDNSSSNSSSSSSSAGIGSSIGSLMCDEIWCQLIKQTTSNPKQASLIRGWELLASISSVFKPSVELFPCAFQFVYEKCFDTNEVGGLAVHTLRELMAQKNNDQSVYTPSARRQANLISVSDLNLIKLTPLPDNIFGCSIDKLRCLELFVKEVKDYRLAVTEMQQRSRKLHMDPALGETNQKNGVLDGSTLFGDLTDEDIDFVTTGGILHIKSIDDKKYRTRYCWVRKYIN